jgi:predicted RNA-binding Zn-ribbon protein involved in translation (DUF1610 family)
MARTIEQAKELIESLIPLQENPPEDGYIFPCPRCGHDRMDKNPVRNALSRRANVYICNSCGMEEALLDAAGKDPLPLNEWAMVQGFDSEDDESEQACRACGCTWDHACEGGCYWVEDDFCSKCAEKMSGLNPYYYTFGTDPEYPYSRGWVEVYASSWEEAHEKFRTRFPDRPGHEGTINCAFFYDQKSWERTVMSKGNMGEFCHEVII